MLITGRACGLIAKRESFLEHPGFCRQEQRNHPLMIVGIDDDHERVAVGAAPDALEQAASRVETAIEVLIHTGSEELIDGEALSARIPQDEARTLRNLEQLPFC